MRSFDVVGWQPQYPTEARQYVNACQHTYREARAVLLDEVRTARLMQRAGGRRVSAIYAADLKRAQWDMALQRAIFWRACNQLQVASVG